MPGTKLQQLLNQVQQEHTVRSLRSLYELFEENQEDFQKQLILCIAKLINSKAQGQPIEEVRRLIGMFCCIGIGNLSFQEEENFVRNKKVKEITVRIVNFLHKKISGQQKTLVIGSARFLYQILNSANALFDKTQLAGFYMESNLEKCLQQVVISLVKYEDYACQQLGIKIACELENIVESMGQFIYAVFIRSEIQEMRESALMFANITDQNFERFLHAYQDPSKEIRKILYEKVSDINFTSQHLKNPNFAHFLYYGLTSRDQQIEKFALTILNKILW